jgi:hypothetical protein
MVFFRSGAILLLAGALACGTSMQPGEGGPQAGNETARLAAGCTQGRVAESLIGVSRIVTLHAQGCSIDDDCLVVDTGLRCLQSCPSAVVAADRDAYLTALDEYGARVCASLPAGCGFSPACAPADARCVSGTCRMVSTQAR